MWSIQTYTHGGPLILHGIPVHGDGIIHGTADLTGAVLIGILIATLTGIHIGILTSAGIGMTTGGIITTVTTSILHITRFTVRYTILQRDLAGMYTMARETTPLHTGAMAEDL